MSMNDNLLDSASMPEDSNDAPPLQPLKNEVKEGSDEDVPSPIAQSMPINGQPTQSKAAIESTEIVTIDQLQDAQKQLDSPTTQHNQSIDQQTPENEASTEDDVKQEEQAQNNTEIPENRLEQENTPEDDVKQEEQARDNTEIVESGLEQERKADDTIEVIEENIKAEEDSKDDTEEKKQVNKEDPLTTQASKKRHLKPKTAQRKAISPQGHRLAMRNARYLRTQRQRSRTFRAVIFLLFLLIVGGSLIPLVVTISYGLRVYATYQTAYTHITDGVHHFLDVKTTLFPASGTPNNASNKKQSPSTTSTLFDMHRLTIANTDFVEAGNDFRQLQTLVSNTDFLQAANQYVPQATPYFRTTQAACTIAIDFSHIGQVLIAAGKTLSPRMSGSLLGEASTPLLMPADLSLLESTFSKIEPFIRDIQAQTHALSLDVLPLSATQRLQIQQYLGLLPQLQGYLNLGQTLVAPLSWILGIGQPRTFLVETMDRAELRATGGFTGQYGELHINGARIAPFSLTNVALLEYANNSPSYGQIAPEPYSSWWPFPNWGLRDANLSADFPTSANFIINRYQYETNQSVDGVIVFTPTLIKQVLQKIGSVSISVPHIKETITAQNLEDKIHYYQLDNTGILAEKLYSNNDDDQQARKVFTSLLSRALMDRVRKASLSELIQIGHLLLQDLRTRDLQVYFTDPQAEALLQSYGYDGSMDTASTHDAFYLVQANVGVNKASQYVQTTMQDTVEVDAAGNATHTLQLHFVYNQLGPVYGSDTYRDYLRLYVPDNATFLSGDGIDQGPATAICGGPFQACPETNVYPKNELVCPPGQYDGGTSDVMNFDPYSTEDHPLDQLGPPVNFQSDQPGRAMFAGYAIVPKNCSLTVTLSWSVPRQAQATGPYSLLVQRQAGVEPILKLDIQSSEQDCSSPAQLTYQSTMESDMLFSLNAVNSKQANTAKCVLKGQEPIKKGS